MLELDLDRLRREIAASERVRVYGTVTSVNGIMRSTLPAALGDQCEIITGPDRSVTAEVIGFTDGTTHIVPYETPETIRSRRNDNEPLTDFTIYCDPRTRAFGFTTGEYPPRRSSTTPDEPTTSD